MALRNPRLFGLDVNVTFADIADKEVALRNLNLPIFDLDTIRGSSNAGAVRDDFVSFSRLKVPIHKTTRRFGDDSNVFSSRLDNRAGIERILFGGLDINGRLSGNAIRYRYVNFPAVTANDASNIIKIADISTSRASAWSSTFSEPIPDTAPISYGAEVKTIGDIIFGSQAGVVDTHNLKLNQRPRLQTSTVAEAREFDSELPTHKMKVTLNNITREMYLMKGIPIVFRGFFRSLDASIGLTLINDVNGNPIPASWKIVERNNTNNYVNFRNQGGTTSSISFRTSVGKERLIQFYYNPDNITSISIPSANISTLPAVKFKEVTSLSFSGNRLQIFPDLVDIAPKTSSLNLSGNQFYYSEIASERRLNAAILNKIPNTVRSLNLSNSFRGSVDPFVISDRIPELQTLTLVRGHFPDDNNTGAPFPTVGNKVTTYNVSSNDFRTIVKDLTRPSTPEPNATNPAFSFEDLPDLVTLDISGNYYTGGAVNLVSSKLQTVNFHNVGFQIPTMPNAAATLATFTGTYMRNAGTFFTAGGAYKFANFNVLTGINFSHAGLSGAFPVFTNAALSSLNLFNTSISGGTVGGDTQFVIPSNTFSNTPNLSSINIRSSSLLTSPIHPDAFSNLTNLSSLYYESLGRTGGAVPNLANCTKLTSVQLGNNAFTGSLPSVNTLKDLRVLYLNNNNFTGAIPVYKNLSSLTRVYLQNNQLESLPKFTNLPSLEYFYAQNNNISGSIPSFVDCPRLYYLILFNNNFSSYTQGAFSTLYRINYIDLSGNSLTSQAVDDILADLLTNYNAVNRGRITINLRGNGTPSLEGQETAEILRSKGWSITTS